MPLKGNTHHYGSVSLVLHWISAAAILALLVLGFAAAAVDSTRAASLLRVHVPLGVLLLALTAVRVGWWFFDIRPGHPAGQPRWQAMMARATHIMLYLVVAVVGVSGIALVMLSGAYVVLFLGKPEPLPNFTNLRPMGVHAAGAFALVGLLCLHIGAALYHQFYKGDHLLARMGIGSAGRA